MTASQNSCYNFKKYNNIWRRTNHGILRKKEPILIPQKSEAGRPLVAGNYVYWVSQSYRDSEGKVGDDRKTIGRIVDNDRTKMWPNNTNYTLIFGTDDDSGDERTHASQMSGGQYMSRRGKVQSVC